ncbi:MAG: FecR family protein [Candidatus Saccharimonas sp.]
MDEKKTTEPDELYTADTDSKRDGTSHDVLSPEIAEPEFATTPEHTKQAASDNNAEPLLDTDGAQNEPTLDRSVPESLEQNITVVEAEGEMADIQTPAVPTPTVEQASTAAAGLAAAKTSALVGKPKRKRVVIAATIALVVVVAAVGIVVALTFGKQTTEETSSQHVAKLGIAVTVVDGKASYKHGANEWQALATTAQLVEGDSIRTAEDGRVVLTFDDGTALRLDYKSAVTLTSLSAKDVRVTQDGGTAYSRVVASDRKYTVAVDDVQYQALGTAFVTIDNDATKGVQVYQSKVKVTGIDDAVAEGKQYYKQHATETLKGKVSDLDLDALVHDEFVTWNTAEDEKSEAFKEKLGVLKTINEKRDALRQATEQAESVAAAQQSAVLRLGGVASESGAVLSWTVTGVDVGSGFKLLRSSTSQTPTLGQDDVVYIEKPSTRGYTWSAKKGSTYWYRICAYRPAASTCVNYSNAVQVTIPNAASEGEKDKTREKVTRGTMTLSVDGSGNATWSYTGVAVHGYKLVVSKSPNPTYPNDSAAYYSRDATTGTVPMSGAGVYYARICAWTDGTETEKCVDYSNQVTVVKT